MTLPTVGYVLVYQSAIKFPLPTCITLTAEAYYASYTCGETVFCVISIITDRLALRFPIFSIKTCLATNMISFQLSGFPNSAPHVGFISVGSVSCLLLWVFTESFCSWQLHSRYEYFYDTWLLRIISCAVWGNHTSDLVQISGNKSRVNTVVLGENKDQYSFVFSQIL